MTSEGFLDRWIRILRQKFAAKSRELDDPAEAIDLLMQNQMVAIAKGRADLVTVSSAEKRLQALIGEFEQRRGKYEADARAALRDGNRDAARTYLRRSLESERLTSEGRTHLEEVAAQRTELVELLEQMRAEYDRLRLRREAVHAMASGARASAQSQESLTAAGESGTERERTLEASRETLARLRARAAALAELRAGGALDAVGAGEFDNRPQIGDAEIDRRLAALEP